MAVFLLHIFTDQRMIIPDDKNLKPGVYLQANDIKLQPPNDIYMYVVPHH